MFLVYFVLACFSLSLGCMDANQRSNRSAEIQNDTIPRDLYDSSNLIFADSVRKMIDRRIPPFDLKEDDSATEIIVDTILFSPTGNRAALFVITKNSNAKLLTGGNENEYHYNADCLLAERFNKSNWRIKWLSAFNFRNYSQLGKIRSRIRQTYFELFKARKGIDGKSLYKYNLNDTRFWNGPAWD